MIDKIIEMIEESEKNGLYREFPHDILSGYSGNKIIGSLQRLMSLYKDHKNVCYLEVVVYQGLTLLSVAGENPQIACFGIDNFAYFDTNGKYYHTIEERKNLLYFSNANLINEDYEDALENLVKYIGEMEFGLYFIDGPHDYRSQLMCLQLIIPYLHKNAVIIVDDANYPHLKKANRDFLATQSSLKLIFDVYITAHPLNMDSQSQGAIRRSWWNGVNIFAKDSNNVLEPIFPK